MVICHSPYKASKNTKNWLVTLPIKIYGNTMYLQVSSPLYKRIQCVAKWYSPIPVDLSLIYLYQTLIRVHKMNICIASLNISLVLRLTQKHGGSLLWFPCKKGTLMWWLSLFNSSGLLFGTDLSYYYKHITYQFNLRIKVYQKYIKLKWQIDNERVKYQTPLNQSKIGLNIDSELLL